MEIKDSLFSETAKDFVKELLSLFLKIEKQKAELKAKDALLKAAKCPNNCRDGVIEYQDGHIEQCQWCYEAEQALKGNNEKKAQEK